MSSLTVKPLTNTDFAAWKPLAIGYKTFYKTAITDEELAAAWQRFHDPAIPIFALGAFDGADSGHLVGIAHYLLHVGCWTTRPIFYLQDLFVSPEGRGQGVGRALIEAVYNDATAQGADRVYWQTHETNQTAMALYNQVAERSGFLVYRKMLNR